MERSGLRARTGMKYSLLDPILEDLEREGMIKRTVDKIGEAITASLTEMCRYILHSYLVREGMWEKTSNFEATYLTLRDPLEHLRVKM